tara:strand:+ start:1580 stop:1846 length:267 start_codon:yes stop_codon:yes gene_type:complete
MFFPLEEYPSVEAAAVPIHSSENLNMMTSADGRSQRHKLARENREAAAAGGEERGKRALMCPSTNMCHQIEFQNTYPLLFLRRFSSAG